VRIQELHALSRVARASGDAAGLAHGHVFKLDQYQRSDANAEYLIVSAHISVSSDDYQTGAAAGPPDWNVSIEAIESKVPFRPARNTPKPVVQGTQTAIVVGKAGEEIWTDKYGRVKVQFHWDRHGHSNENSSCWVRVAQLWAGKQWGAIHIPRIGQEVLVSFLEGDPDQPIITGRVYNGDEMPPYALPANATQSGIKSSSSKGGSGSNELRFEDKAGSEEVYLHAQKDWKSFVENNQSTEIKKDRTDLVDQNESLKVTKDRKREVGGGETVKIGKDQSIDVGKKYLLKAGDEITLQTGAAKIVMKKSGEITIEGLKITVKGSTSVKVEAGVQVDIKGTKTTVKGTMLELTADAIAKLRGGMTIIG
jgi:type VI secretion system secreted protein VgrG